MVWNQACTGFNTSSKGGLEKRSYWVHCIGVQNISVKGHQKIGAQKPTNVQIRLHKGSPETCQGALGRAVVVGVVGEEGEVLAVEGELAGVVEEAVGSHQSTWERRKVKKRGNRISFKERHTQNQFS